MHIYSLYKLHCALLCMYNIIEDQRSVSNMYAQIIITKLLVSSLGDCIT